MDASDRSGGRWLIFGPPGSGKGTQAVFVAERLSIPAISTGEMLRGAVAAGSELGGRVESIMARGELVDDDTMAEVVEHRLAEDDASHGFLLDGYPRTLPQAETLAGILRRRGESLDGVLMLTVGEETLVERLLGRGRADDREDVIRERLRVYREKTEPLVAYYEREGGLVPIDGDQSIEKVTAEITRAIGVEV